MKYNVFQDFKDNLIVFKNNQFSIDKENVSGTPMLMYTREDQNLSLCSNSGNHKVKFKDYSIFEVVSNIVNDFVESYCQDIKTISSEEKTCDTL